MKNLIQTSILVLGFLAIVSQTTAFTDSKKTSAPAQLNPRIKPHNQEILYITEPCLSAIRKVVDVPC